MDHLQGSCFSVMDYLRVNMSRSPRKKSKISKVSPTFLHGTQLTGFLFRRH